MTICHNNNNNQCYLGHVESVGDDEADLTGVHGVGVKDSKKGGCDSNLDKNNRLTTYYSISVITPSQTCLCPQRQFEESLTPVPNSGALNPELGTSLLHTHVLSPASFLAIQ